ncbi:hypothetical protein L6164_031998 [Bauhinia variegata]|uniref:Uncharacterized protein n=1 Tax=Bauhinia variegata TaxID=167791 RepID=A0ACB9KMF5_BAUVA|nr:hypothetical protein L6164_031998 [Bauhinia variegata]
MRTENAAKEKEQKEAVRAFEQIEAKAKRSYQTDVVKFEVARESHALDDRGKWVTQEEAYASASPHFLSNSGHKGPTMSKPSSASQSASVENKASNKSQNGSPPGPVPVVSSSLNPTRSVKFAPSSLNVGKRKRPNEKQRRKSSTQG